MDEQPDLPDRQSLRLPTFDYASSGAYYVTIDTCKNQPFFNHAELRAIFETTWKTLPERFAGVTLDEFVMMPDHIHFILWLDATNNNRQVLGNVVGAYKSLVAVGWIRVIKANKLPFSGRLWQRNYYEHIIRNDFELDQKRTYIRNNPVKQEMKRSGTW